MSTPVPSSPFPELGSPPHIPTPAAVVLRDSGHVIIGPKCPWAIVLQPSEDGVKLKVKRRGADNRYDDVYEHKTAIVTEWSVAQLVTRGVAYIAAEVLSARGVSGEALTRVNDSMASVVVRANGGTWGIVEVAHHPRYQFVRVGNKSLPCAREHSLNMSLFFGTATFLSALN